MGSGTEFGRNDPLAVQRWSEALAVESEVYQYWRKYMGAGKDFVVCAKKDLEKKAGESITMGLRLKLTGGGTEGDNIIEGTSAEEDLSYKSDKITIDQRRKSTKSKGKMSEQRVPYPIRLDGRDALAVWFGEDYDQQMFIYAAGIPPADTNLFDSTYTFLAMNPGYHSDLAVLAAAGRAANAIGDSITYAAASPFIDSGHHIWAGDASSAADIDSADTFSIVEIEKAVAKAETVDPMIPPIKMDGENKFIVLMHTYQAYNMRKATSDNDWVDIRKNTDGKESPLYKNALGEYAGCILHKHRYVPRFYANSLACGRALFLGAQALGIAFGGAGQYGRYSWNEEFDDRGNALVITAGSIYGIKRSYYNSKVFGLFAIDSACVDPTA